MTSLNFNIQSSPATFKDLTALNVTRANYADDIRRLALLMTWLWLNVTRANYADVIRRRPTPEVVKTIKAPRH